MADVKICGIRTPDDLAVASAAGARWIGMVFFEKSPRHLSLDQAALLRDSDMGKAQRVLPLLSMPMMLHLMPLWQLPHRRCCNVMAGRRLNVWLKSNPAMALMS